MLTYYPLDPDKDVIRVCGIPSHGWRDLVAKLADDEADEDNFRSLELFGPDEDYVEAVTYKGEVIGTLDNPPRYDISEYETFDQMEARETAEEAARDVNYEARLDARRAAE